ncbi:hypothetical protein CO115_02055 [Candidatus Falkowbacteria bacterium CG_4_9_14_3_um_filter_36_9]|uniref:Uncharacterized protein n=2 Tax=Candidatus Falkowiibacteriota TaxID=1752728 RepID=A0A1J4T9Q3_9BACT|nr:MAG: hypothetical protein AUJ27_03325 [Candidatus Falkowbacteria bacterium CG1_02_37_44]PIV51936.1 MAG: hypothetical protein COS18_01255 [Candidatus Falkowbacteria bacterium CG02_land_8_20_14_3_00_36_14]PIX12103.1 MAG: hypothetical protein COZ73_00980 [Candidatus Falkowbacteria bacterium CG_4_8_14_3_um_filter_36_11]PJA10722.1 MAG: hypothetical protein COX67_03520 [Candidatus Falkowbacteria bacterium CG_4_10_14_0_2_um_filter_36_22]PJB19897.1 MAG: hypothetical protein CO115_02055 [Candidatus F
MAKRAGGGGAKQSRRELIILISIKTFKRHRVSSAHRDCFVVPPLASSGISRNDERKGSGKRGGKCVSPNIIKDVLKFKI